MKGGQQKDRQKYEQNMTLPYIITAITTMPGKLWFSFHSGGVLWIFIGQTNENLKYSATVEIDRVSRHAYHNSSPQFQKEIPDQRKKAAAANKTCLESKIIWLENKLSPSLSVSGGEWTYQRLLHYYATFSLYITAKSDNTIQHLQ